MSTGSAFGCGICVGIGLLGVLLASLDLNPPAIEKKWQIEIVKHGAAYWQVNDDGSTTFKWKEEIKP